MWKIVIADGGWCVEHDGYFIDLCSLQGREEFWVDHIGGKTWGTSDVVDDLVGIIRRLT